MCSSCFADSIPNFCYCCIRRFRDTVAALVCIGTIELVRLVVAAFCAIQKRIKPLCPCGNFRLALSRLLRKVHFDTEAKKITERATVSLRIFICRLDNRRWHVYHYAHLHCLLSLALLAANYNIFPNTRFAYLPTFTRTPGGSFPSLSEVKAEIRRTLYFFPLTSSFSPCRPSARLTTRRYVKDQRPAGSRRTLRIIPKPPRPNQARR